LALCGAGLLAGFGLWAAGPLPAQQPPIRQAAAPQLTPLPEMRAPAAAFAARTPITPIAISPAPDEEAAQCRSWCSAVQPGQVITEISWAETDGASAPDEEARLDISASAAGLNAQQFATLRLAAVPMAIAPPGREVDLEQVKQRMAPALLQPVEKGRIVARPAAVRDMNKVMARRQAMAVRQPDPARAAIDAPGLALAQLGNATAVVQQLRREGGRTLHVLTLEGLEAGLSYEFAVRTRAMTRPAGNLCRIPVCPSEMMASPPQ
jgi:hypothetical protein